MTGNSALEIRCRRSGASPTVAVRVWLVGGLLAEALPGQGLITGRMLVEGTRRRTWKDIAAESEALGMDISAFGGPEVIGLSIDALAGDWRTALEWAAELTLESAFPEDRVRWVTNQAGGELDSLSEQPDVVTAWAFLDQLYAPHPWSRPLQGNRDSLGQMTREHCVAFHRHSLERGCIVSVAGDLDEGPVRDEVARLFAPLAAGAVAASPEVEPPARSETERRRDLPLSEQAHVYMGHLTVPLAHPDRVALVLAAVVMGAGPGLAGRLPERIREREALAYSTHVATISGAGSAPGRLLVYVGTSADKVEQARVAVREELERLVVGGIEETEIDEARRYLLGSMPFRRETARQVAALQAGAAYHGLPLDDSAWLESRLRESTRASVEEAVRRHIDPSALLTTVGYPAGA